MRNCLFRILCIVVLATQATFSFAEKPQQTTASPLFVITPLVSAPSTTFQGTTITVIYQIINNTGFNLNNISVVNLPTNVTQVTTGNAGYCNSNPFSLASSASCLFKVEINTNNINHSFQWNPKVCTDSAKPFYCAEAYPSDQVAITIIPSLLQSCDTNFADITYELAQSWDDGVLNPGWGYSPRSITMDPNFQSCTTGSGGTTWQQKRVIAVADFWVKQKINYCHHYSSDYLTPAALRCDSASDGPSGANGGCCSLRPNLQPTSPQYGQIVRWNYSGTDSQTAQYWQQFTRLWYGTDCTNFTRLVYNFAFGTLTTGKTSAQAGQDPNNPSNDISPNQQTSGNQLNYSCAPGSLVCGDGTVDQGGNTFCAGHGGPFATNNVGNYFSLIDSNGNSQSSNPTIVAMAKSQLSVLLPGDLVYIAGSLDTGSPSDTVTHAVIWTGKVVGYGPDDINPSLIAPDELCTPASHCNWQGTANLGAWVIIDSHYQGADYRVFTDFFYLYDIWGVRRIIGSSVWVPGYNCNPPD